MCQGMAAEPDAGNGEGVPPRGSCWEGLQVGEGIPAGLEPGPRGGACREACLSPGDVLGSETRGDRAGTGFFELTGDAAALPARRPEGSRAVLTMDREYSGTELCKGNRKKWGMHGTVASWGRG